MSTVTAYNHFLKLAMNKELTLTNLKAMLLDNTATFTASETAMTNLTGHEVSGNGWDSGGEVLQSVSVSIFNTNGANLDAADLSILASGGDIGPARKCVIYDATGSWPLIFYDFEADKTAASGSSFLLRVHTDGLLKLNYV